jgi:hypothetical protein
VFRLWGFIFAFSNSKSMYLLLVYKIPDIWIYYTTILILSPFLGCEGLFSPFWPPKVCFFLFHVKFPIVGYITPHWFWASNSVFGLWRPIFTFLTPKRIYFFDLYKNFRRLMGHMTYFIFEPTVPSLGIPNFF